ncbi:MAG: RNA-binding S4 domain-containing protein [Rhodospirillales bacterium]|nr:RNA-binding S4 domain-containing protein [Rhodospirillales bacterium]
MTDPTLRLDKWLWYARLFKSRTLAAKLCQSGRMRVNGTLIGKSKQVVNQGDVLTFPKGEHIRIIKVLLLGNRRGPAAEAQTLYEDLEPPKAKKAVLEMESADVRTAPVAKRGRGTGRPTKTERRALDKLRGDPEDDAG